jgi:hypothetical protein
MHPLLAKLSNKFILSTTANNHSIITALYNSGDCRGSYVKIADRNSSMGTGILILLRVLTRIHYLMWAHRAPLHSGVSLSETLIEKVVNPLKPNGYLLITSQDRWESHLLLHPQTYCQVRPGLYLQLFRSMEREQVLYLLTC